MRTIKHSRGDVSPARSMIRTSLVLSLISLPVLVGATWLLRGGTGALSALVAWLVVVAFFTVGHFGVRAVIGGEPGLSIAGAFVVYLGQLIALVAAFLVLRRSGWVDGPAFAVVAVVQTLVWQVGHVAGFRRARHEIYPDVTLPRTGA